MLHYINKFVLGGLVVSGLAGLLFPLASSFPRTLGPALTGLFAGGGLIFGGVAMALMIIGFIRYSMNRFASFWETLYPINFGLTLLGFTYVTYTDSVSYIFLIGVVGLAILCAYGFIQMNVLNMKIVILLLTVTPFLIPIVFWPTLIFSILFLTISGFIRFKNSSYFVSGPA